MRFSTILADLQQDVLTTPRTALYFCVISVAAPRYPGAVVT